MLLQDLILSSLLLLWLSLWWKLPKSWLRWWYKFLQHRTLYWEPPYPQQGKCHHLQRKGQGSQHLGVISPHFHGHPSGPTGHQVTSVTSGCHFCRLYLCPWVLAPEPFHQGALQASTWYLPSGQNNLAPDSGAMTPTNRLALLWFSRDRTPVVMMDRKVGMVTLWPVALLSVLHMTTSDRNHRIFVG